jgi:hypothetical protein
LLQAITLNLASVVWVFVLNVVLRFPATNQDARQGQSVSSVVVRVVFPWLETPTKPPHPQFFTRTRFLAQDAWPGCFGVLFGNVLPSGYFILLDRFLDIVINVRL